MNPANLIEGLVYEITFPGNFIQKFTFIRSHQHPNGTIDYEFKDQDSTMYVYGNDLHHMTFRLLDQS